MNTKIRHFGGRSLFFSFVGALSLMGCSAATEEGDEATESSDLTSRGRAALGLQDGSPTAAAVLKLANYRSYSANDYVANVGITRAAANSLLRYRRGANAADESDDNLFDSITELDSIPNTGAVFWKKFVPFAIAMNISPEVAAQGGVEVGTHLFHGVTAYEGAWTQDNHSRTWTSASSDGVLHWVTSDKTIVVTKVLDERSIAVTVGPYSGVLTYSTFDGYAGSLGDLENGIIVSAYDAGRLNLRTLTTRTVSFDDGSRAKTTTAFKFESGHLPGFHR